MNSAVPIDFSPGFLGLGLGLGIYQPSFLPPDTVGAIGPLHYVQAVNASLAVFDRSGRVVAGPTDLRALFSPLGGLCALSNDGHPTVAYDRPAGRWVISELANSGGTTTFSHCVAVSQTSDPTAAWTLFSFDHPLSLDNPHLSVWPDGYYLAADAWNGPRTLYYGGRVCALERTKMLAGQMPSMQCFSTPTAFFSGLIVADHDGPTPPPAGSPAYVLSLSDSPNAMSFWKLHVDWAMPNLSTFTGPTQLVVSPFTRACAAMGGACVTQPSTVNLLDGNGDRLSGRVVYRNRVTHEALLATHSVTADTSVGVRWYELRSPATSPVIFQEGTIAPDLVYRWNPSLAMDLAGNIAVGYSASSAALSVLPSIRASGHLVGDEPGVTSQGESEAFRGTAYLMGVFHRWGSSAMNVDPLDDCTFWFTNQYIPIPTTTDWATRIGSFRYASCSSADFALVPTPATLSMAAGVTRTSTIQSTQLGAAGNLMLSAEVAPAGQGVTATVNPSMGMAGLTSTLSVTTTPTVVGGAYTVTVTGVEGSVTHSTQVGVSVSQVDFTISAAPNALTLAQGMTGTSAVMTTAVRGPGTVRLSTTVTPPAQGVNATLAPASVPAGSGATLTVQVSASATPGTYTIDVTGNEGAVTHVAPVTVIVPAPPDFTISAQVPTLDLIVGRSKAVGIHTTQVGPPGSVRVSAFVTPAGQGLGASLDVAQLAAGNDATLTLNALSNGNPGLYTVIVTGTEGAIVRAATMQVTVQAESDFTIAASPSAVTLKPGFSTSSTVTTTQLNAPGNLTLAATVAPAGQGVSATLDASMIAAGAGTKLTITAGDTAQSGIYRITVLGVEGAALHSAVVTLSLILPADFALGSSTGAMSMVQGERRTATISTTQQGVASTVALAVEVTPPLQGVTALIVPNQLTVGQSANLSVTATEIATPGNYLVTVKGTEGPATHSLSINLVVTALPADFAVTLSSPTFTLKQGSSTTGTLSTMKLGSPGTVDFTATVSPEQRGVTVALDPSSFSAGNTSTFTIAASAGAPAGTYTLTFSGLEGELQRSAEAQVTVTALPKPKSTGCDCSSASPGDLAPFGWFVLVALAMRRRR